MSLDVYTDGGCSGNPGCGAWAFVVYHSPERYSSQSGVVDFTTNNKMELTAVIKALHFCLEEIRQTRIRVFTDSRYVQMGITQWIQGWVKNAWRTASKKAVKNKALWEELLELSKGVHVSWEWVKGHSVYPGNNLCHRLVEREIRMYQHK